MHLVRVYVILLVQVSNYLMCDSRQGLDEDAKELSALNVERKGVGTNS